MDRAVLGRLAGMPDRLADAARAADPQAPAHDEWSPADIVRHLIAVELEVWHVRLAQLATEDHPAWAWAEPDRWIGEPEAPFERLLDAYREARKATIDRLAALDWSRTGTHATLGELDVAGLLTIAAEHDDEHLASLAR